MPEEICYYCEGPGPFELSTYSDICDDCYSRHQRETARRKEAARKAQLTKANRGTYVYRNRYGSHDFSVEQYDEMVQAQGGVCAVCNEAPRLGKLLVDHDHSCHPKRACAKCIRGLICTNCNSGLGKLGDTIAGLERALTYLKAYEARRVEA